jgi:hypothetical protein
MLCIYVSMHLCFYVSTERERPPAPAPERLVPAARLARACARQHLRARRGVTAPQPAQRWPTRRCCSFWRPQVPPYSSAALCVAAARRAGVQHQRGGLVGLMQSAQKRQAWCRMLRGAEPFLSPTARWIWSSGRVRPDPGRWGALTMSMEGRGARCRRGRGREICSCARHKSSWSGEAFPRKSACPRLE